MKRRLLAFLLTGLFFLPLLRAATGDWQAEWGRLLAAYATPSGVRYAEWKAKPGDVAALGRIVGRISQETPDALSREEQLAYYMNAYNAWMIQIVLENYPLKSVTKLGVPYSVFYSKRIRLGGEKMSLNHLEREIIIKRYREPRIHVAINCASRSCPPLPGWALAGEKLDAQLDELSRGFAVDPHAVQIDTAKKRLLVSKIFDWFKEDFAPLGGAVGFLNRHRSEPLPADYEVDFQEYDWALNEAAPERG